MIGLVIALLVVGARELFDTSVRSESDIEDVLEAPVLATIESLPRQLGSPSSEVTAVASTTNTSCSLRTSRRSSTATKAPFTWR